MPTPKVRASMTARRLKQLRAQSRLSLREIAESLGMTATGYQHYEDRFKKRYLPGEMRTDLIAALVPRGIPAEEISNLFVKADAKELASTPLSHEHGASGVPRLTEVIEVDVPASAGAGGLVEKQDDDQIWGFPTPWLRTELNAKPRELYVMTIEGDSMVSDPPQPYDLAPGDKTVINTGDQTPTPPGTFIIHDGLGLVAKRIEFIDHSDPPTIRVMSNNPGYEPYERALVDAHILGRVVGRWQRL